MNHQSKYHENKRFIEAYARYLDYTTISEKIKLSAEIGRLAEQNKIIEQMSFEAAKRNHDEYFIEVLAIFPEIGEFEPILPDGRQLSF